MSNETCAPTATLGNSWIADALPSDSHDAATEILDSQSHLATEESSILRAENEKALLPVRRAESLLDFFLDENLDKEPETSSDFTLHHKDCASELPTVSRSTHSAQTVPGPEQSSESEPSLWKIRQGFLQRSSGRGTRVLYNLMFELDSQCHCSSCPEHCMSSSEISETQSIAQGNSPKNSPSKCP